jgi:polysaccharide biosynthesis protein PslH
MKWLFATVSPWPMSNGTALRVWNLCQHLTCIGETVTVVSDFSGDGYPLGYEKAGVTVYQTDSGTHIRRSHWDPYEVRASIASKLATCSGDFDVVVLTGVSMLQYTKNISTNALVIADVIDDPVLETRRQLRHGFGFRDKVRKLRFLAELLRYESRYLDAVKAMFFVSDADRDSFTRRHRKAKVFTSPNGVDLAYWASVANSPIPADSKDVVFVGNLSFYPNELACDTLVRRVAPHVWQRHPEVCFRLVGANPPPALSRLTNPRVEFTNRVPDVRPYLQSAAVVCIPMSAGTGIKNKFLEAWASARPVVATPLACQGLPVAHENNALVGASPKELAQQICRLLENGELQSRIANAGHMTAQGNFSWDFIAQNFRSMVFQAAGWGDN